MKKVILVVAVLIVLGGILFWLSKLSTTDNSGVINDVVSMRDNLLLDLGIKEREKKDFEEYVVKEGDTLDSIAQTYEISKNTIINANSLEDESLSTGQTLRIPPADGVLITVQEGDTLESIAGQYNADKQSIADFNWLDYPYTLNSGDILFVPVGNL